MRVAVVVGVAMEFVAAWAVTPAAALGAVRSGLEARPNCGSHLGHRSNERISERVLMGSGRG